MNNYECKIKNMDTGETRIITVAAEGYAAAAEEACVASGYANPMACWVLSDSGDMQEVSA